MAEDAQCISSTLFNRCTSLTEAPAKKRQKTNPQSCQLLIMDIAARAEVLGYVGNCFGSRSQSISSWPTIESHGKMLLHGGRGGRPFNFDILFDTHRVYMDPSSQIGALCLDEDDNELDLKMVANIIEQQIVTPMLAKSPVLCEETLVSRVFSSSCGTMLCWNISPGLHSVLVRTVLLGHFSLQSKNTHSIIIHDLSEKEMGMLLSNIQTMILKMQVCSSFFCYFFAFFASNFCFILQVCSSHGLNVTFVQPSSTDSVSVFLDANEEILQGDRLFTLCSHPYYKMNPWMLAKAVALNIVYLVHEACMNKDDMLHAVEDEELAATTRPEWWLCNRSEEEGGCKGDVLCFSKHLIPIVQVHPMHSQDNDRLCMECRGIFEDPDLYWPFLEREDAVQYNGWVDFVLEEVVLKNVRQQWLCAKLLDEKQVVY